MRHHRLDEPLAEAFAAITFEDVDVAQIREGRAIGHDAEADRAEFAISDRGVVVVEKDRKIN